ncbi:MAG: right-handed parallel beta-helix repeat-containing protein [Roseibium album]|uniref:right-handed parallel beta-helix repeat-containing protein n=1 Tax=Roseibium album TaxID=311410 RepID=UPI0032EE43EB
MAGYGLQPIDTKLRSDVPGGRLTIAKEVFKQSPFIVDAVLTEPSNHVFYRSPVGELSGLSRQSWRFYSSGASSVVAEFKFKRTNAYSPRVWLYNELGQLIDAGQRSSEVSGLESTVAVKVPAAGVYRLQFDFRLENVSEISLRTDQTTSRLKYADYVRENTKKINLIIPAAQLDLLDGIVERAKSVWHQDVPDDVYWPRYEGVGGRVFGILRTDSGDDVRVAIGLSGRSPVHLPVGDNPLPSLDIKVLAGPMPFQMRRFKLYASGGKESSELVHTSILEDYGVLNFRQDRVNVTLNGRDVGHMFLLETPSESSFEGAQRVAGPVFGYDPDETSARFYDNKFSVVNFSSNRHMIGHEFPDLAGPQFVEKLDRSQMMMIQSYGLTYAAYHGLGQGDMRYHWNARTASYDPMARDLDAGILPPVPGQLLGAWLYFNPLAPQWRPNAVTIASYYLSHSSTGREVYLGEGNSYPLFLWHTPPSTLNLFEQSENHRAFVAYSNMWASDWSRERITARMNNLHSLTGHPPTDGLIPIVQDRLAGSLWESTSDPKKDATVRLGQLISDVTQKAIVPTPTELAFFELRNNRIRHFADSEPRTEVNLVGVKSEGTEPKPVITFLYRREEPNGAHYVFVERSPSQLPSDFVLKSLDGEVIQPKGSKHFEGKTKSISDVSIVLNDFAEDEAVRLYWFFIPRSDAYTYVYPSIEGNAVAFTPREMVIAPLYEPIAHPKDQSLASVFHKENKTLKLLQNDLLVDRPIVIEADETLDVSTKSTIRFSKRGCLTFYGSLEVAPGASLTLKAETEEDGWAGLHFMDSPDQHIRNLTVEGVGDGSEIVYCDDRSFTGGVSFYNTNASLKNVKIENMRIEDALHLLRAEVSIDDFLVTNTQSDCLDLDFSVLDIRGSKFVSCGGDGLDSSGSLLHVTNNELVGSKDKNISAGENSKVVLRENKIEGATIGIAVKDASLVEIGRNVIKGNRTGVAVYSKKPYFVFPDAVVDSGAVFAENSVDFEGQVRTIAP